MESEQGVKTPVWAPDRMGDGGGVGGGIGIRCDEYR